MTQIQEFQFEIQDMETGDPILILLPTAILPYSKFLQLLFTQETSNLHLDANSVCKIRASPSARLNPNSLIVVVNILKSLLVCKPKCSPDRIHTIVASYVKGMDKPYKTISDWFNHVQTSIPPLKYSLWAWLSAASISDIRSLWRTATTLQIFWLSWLIHIYTMTEEEQKNKSISKDSLVSASSSTADESK